MSTRSLMCSEAGLLEETGWRGVYHQRLHPLKSSVPNVLSGGKVWSEEAVTSSQAPHLTLCFLTTMMWAALLYQAFPPCCFSLGTSWPRTEKWAKITSQLNWRCWVLWSSHEKVTKIETNYNRDNNRHSPDFFKKSREATHNAWTNKISHIPRNITVRPTQLRDSGFLESIICLYPGRMPLSVS